MNSLLQYIELYESNADALDRHSAGALNAARKGAMELLRKAGRLPDTSDEGYAKTSVNDLFAPDYGVNVTRVNIPADVAASFRCGVPNLSSLLGLTVNDRFFPTEQLVKNCPEGLTVCSLARAAKEYPGLVEKFYGRVAAASGMDAPCALNTLLAQDGVFIHVGRGVHVARPLQLVDIFSSPTPLLAARRVLVVAEEDSSLAILKCDHTQPGAAACLASEVIELSLARGARVEWYDIEEASDSTSRMAQFYALQAEGTGLNICASTLTNGSTRNEFRIRTEGEHTHTSLHAMAIGSGTQHIDNFSSVIHAAGHAHSRQLFKYVLDDRATGAFEGGIEVCPGARFVEAYQSNRNILASAGARMHSMPQLLIYNDDVKCSHGATTGQLDADALFYMQTRGIPAAEARRMLMQAFMIDVIDSIELIQLRDRLRHMVERRFSGAADCGSCASCANASSDRGDDE
ncbi:MAG: Fe-S cluster assembly protein SufD [Muribaculaceae bacterium]|nr:Fe-S cluster assembly protein SufD [Muribaculaceae bacterium]